MQKGCARLALLAQLWLPVSVGADAVNIEESQVGQQVREERCGLETLQDRVEDIPMPMYTKLSSENSSKSTATHQIVAVGSIL